MPVAGVPVAGGPVAGATVQGSAARGPSSNPAPERASQRDLPPLIVLGLMSGTSLDGIDTVTVRLERTGGRLDWQVLSRSSTAYEPELRARLRRAIDPRSSDVLLLTELHQQVGQAYATAVAGAVGAAGADAPPDLVALSGQTVYHVPRIERERGWNVISTLQIGEASVVSERCGVTTVSDFRQADMAAGGQGAPLVSFSDLLLYHRPGVTRVVQNIGGIGNLTLLPADGAPDGVLAFDTGPGNAVIDEAMEALFGVGYDDDGRVAASGRVDERALERLMADAYYKLEPPKTTGRELFTFERARAQAGLADLQAADVIATLTALTAASIADAYVRFLPVAPAEVLVAGGGARNPVLMRMLGDRLNDLGASPSITTFADVGYDDKDRETLAMAVMGYMAVHGEPNVLPSATGAGHPVVAGKIQRPWKGGARATGAAASS